METSRVAPTAPPLGGSELAPALRAQRLSLDGLNCYCAGSGPPLLLVHSVNAVASAAEVRPLFERYRATRTVFAPDLPGFGLSDRSPRAYTPRLMTDALHAVSAQIARLCGPAPVDGLAVSLGCEFLARAAVESPARWGRLAFVSPTGLNGRKARRGPPGSTRAIPGLHGLLSVPLWSEALFRALTHPVMVRYFLRRAFGSKRIDEKLWAYDVSSARQPGARHAPLHFLSGGLFSADIHTVYEALPHRVWFSHGLRGDFTDFRSQSIVRSRPNWSFEVFPTGAMPYFEMPHDFCEEFDAFLARPPTRVEGGRDARAPVPRAAAMQCPLPG
jgi:pimeloyl-ACP methyl ester carboxylesterase